MEELDLYTGKLTYKGIEFSYAFDKEELRLIPSTDKRDEVRHTILMKEIRPGVYTMASPSMDEPYLIGKCNETGQTIVFLTKQGAHIGSYNEVLFVEIAGSNDKVVVETKLTSNSQLRHGIEIQLPIYMKQEKTKQAIYLIIDNGHPKALENFISFYNGLDQETKRKVSYLIVDATPKLSASKA